MLGSDEHFNLYQQYYAMRLPQPRERSVWLTRVEELCKLLHVKTVVDYGCGTARGLSVSPEIKVFDYDPGVIGLGMPPAPKGLVCCIHTLEHVEPACIKDVIEHMESLASRAVFAVVSTEVSTKKLPDGSPWHSLVQSAAWWQETLGAKYEEQPSRQRKEFAALWVKE